MATFTQQRQNQIAVTQIIRPINPKVYTIWSFSEKKKKKFAKDMGALSHVFNKILASVYSVPCSLQGSRIGKATEIDIISHFFPCS